MMPGWQFTSSISKVFFFSPLSFLHTEMWGEDCFRVCLYRNTYISLTCFRRTTWTVVFIQQNNMQCLLTRTEKNLYIMAISLCIRWWNLLYLTVFVSFNSLSKCYLYNIDTFYFWYIYQALSLNTFLEYSILFLT